MRFAADDTLASGTARICILLHTQLSKIVDALCHSRSNPCNAATSLSGVPTDNCNTEHKSVNGSKKQDAAIVIATANLKFPTVHYKLYYQTNTTLPSTRRPSSQPSRYPKTAADSL